MSLAGLLGDTLSQLQPTAAPAASSTPLRPVGWVIERIRSDHGLLVLQRAGLAHDVDDVVDVAAVLARSGRRSITAIAGAYGWSPGWVQRARRALRQIAGLEQLGRSWAPDPVGKVATIPVWNGKQHWLLGVSLELLTEKGKMAIDRHKSSRPLVMRVARHDAKVADGRTGRGVRTSHETVARALRVSRDAVRHARYVLESIDMSVTVVQGRYLTAEERRAAHAHHGGRQRRIASTRHLTMPRRLVTMVARHLPRSGSVSPTPLESSKSPRRAGTAKKRPALPPIPLVWQKLAGQVASVAPHLAANHLGNLARGLSRLPLDPTRWTGHGLVHLIYVANRTSGKPNQLPRAIRWVCSCTSAAQHCEILRDAWGMLAAPRDCESEFCDTPRGRIRTMLTDPNPNEGELLTSAQVAARLGIAAEAFKSRLRRGRFPMPNAPARHRNHWTSQLVEAWISANTIPEDAIRSVSQAAKLLEVPPIRIKHMPPPDGTSGGKPWWNPTTIREGAVLTTLPKVFSTTADALTYLGVEASKWGEVQLPPPRNSNGWTERQLKTVRPRIIRELTVNEERLYGRDVATFTGLSWDTVRTYRRTGVLPEPDGLDGHRPWWSQTTIEQWDQSRRSTTGRPRKATPST